MNPFAFWPTCTVVTVAAVIDVRHRRIPNWLVVPFLAFGILSGGVADGSQGVIRSLSGIALAGGIAGPFCYLRGMGMGDLKLLAGIGAWLGPRQLASALVATALAGGILALAVALWKRSLLRCLDGLQELLAGFWERGFRPHGALALDNAGVVKIPYAVAIATGTIFSFYVQ